MRKFTCSSVAAIAALMEMQAGVGSTAVGSRALAERLIRVLVRDGYSLHHIQLDADDCTDYHGLYYISLTDDGVICEAACTSDGEYKYIYAGALYLVNFDDDTLLDYIDGCQPIAVDLLSSPAPAEIITSKPLEVMLRAKKVIKEDNVAHENIE